LPEPPVVGNVRVASKPPRPPTPRLPLKASPAPSTRGVHAKAIGVAAGLSMAAASRRATVPSVRTTRAAMKATLRKGTPALATRGTTKASAPSSQEQAPATTPTPVARGKCVPILKSASPPITPIVGMAAAVGAMHTALTPSPPVATGGSSAAEDGKASTSPTAGRCGDQPSRRRDSKRPRPSPGDTAPNAKEPAPKRWRRASAAKSAPQRPATKPVRRSPCKTGRGGQGR